MGEIAVQTLLKRIESPREAYPEFIMFEPELMVRESTGAAPVEPQKTTITKRRRSKA
jgi:DNA-binding LacI/PurR family transcriptional regulator